MLSQKLSTVLLDSKFNFLQTVGVPARLYEFQNETQKRPNTEPPGVPEALDGTVR